MRIKQIAIGDFRKTATTLYLEFAQENPEVAASLAKDDMLVFISRTGTQLLFTHGFDMFQAANDTNSVLPSHRYPLSRGTWNPLMLKNYANAAGLHIEGLKAFEEHYKHLAEEAKKAD